MRSILDIAERADFLIFEDDVYVDLCRTPVTRLAPADKLRRVIYASSFSKTIAANIRVGYIACSPEIAESIADTKILSGFTTPEVNERLVHKLLVEGRYDRQVRRDDADSADHSRQRPFGCQSGLRMTTGWVASCNTRTSARRVVSPAP